jgi:hypothetical protein
LEIKNKQEVRYASQNQKKGRPKGEKRRVCGYRIIVDEACGCAEEHVFVCCDKPMKKKA